MSKANMTGKATVPEIVQDTGKNVPINAKSRILTELDGCVHSVPGAPWLRMEQEKGANIAGLGIVG